MHPNKWLRPPAEALCVIAKSHVVAIDELESSLHPDLATFFLQMFLMNSKDSQILATTHAQYIMELDYMRSDMVWFCEKDETGASVYYCAQNIVPIVRNPCIEIWFLMHFMKTPQSRIYESYEALEKVLCNYLPNYAKKKEYFASSGIFNKLEENNGQQKLFLRDLFSHQTFGKV